MTKEYRMNMKPSIKGCTKCMRETRVAKLRGSHPIDLRNRSARELEELLGEDAEEKAKAFRTCPKCQAELTERNDMFVQQVNCAHCGAEIPDLDFCVNCGFGMYPGLFKKLVKKGLDPSIMLS